MRKPILNGLCLGIGLLVAMLLFGATLDAQNAGEDQTLNITIQVLDGRNGRPLADQHLLVFTGLSIDAVKSHAAHTGLTTNEIGMGTLSVYPSKTQWVQIFADGRVLCFPTPNQSSFSVNEIMSKGLVISNTCSSLVKEAKPGQLIVFARPAGFLEKMKQ